MQKFKTFIVLVDLLNEILLALFRLSRSREGLSLQYWAGRLAGALRAHRIEGQNLPEIRALGSILADKMEIEASSRSQGSSVSLVHISAP